MNIDHLLNPYYTDFFQSVDPLVILYGGAGAGKSFSVVDKMLLLPLITKQAIKMIVVRKTLPSLKRSVLDIFIQRLDTFKIPYKFNKVDMVLELPYGSKIVMLSINGHHEIEKIKSITDVSIIWIEEANELIPEAFDQLKLRLRGGSLKWRQMILTFNPIGSTSWIYSYFFEINNRRAKKIHKTYKHNPWLDDNFIQTLIDLKDTNENLYNVYTLGKWGQLEGTIFKNWKLVNKLPEGIKQTIVGIDFGFNAPTAVTKIHFVDDPKKVYIEELLYQSNLTNNQLIEKLKTLNINPYVLFCDSAEPGRIQELRTAGFKVREANKKVDEGIQYLQTLELNILEGSDNLVKELNSYEWQRDKNGNYIDEPVKFRDHLIDSIRYGIFTNKKSMIASPVSADGNGEIGNVLQNLIFQQQFKNLR